MQIAMAGNSGPAFCKKGSDIASFFLTITATDMKFYDFMNAKPILKWKSEVSS